jgi:hypothetical protein
LARLPASPTEREKVVWEPGALKAKQISAQGLELMQIWLGLTHRTHGVHRVLGKVYAASILVATASLDATAGTKPTFALIITS